MRASSRIVLAVIFLTLSVVIAFPRSQTATSQPAQATKSAPPSPTTPNVGIWNDSCFASNMTVANPQCGLNGASLAVGSKLTVDVNVTNAPLFNGYEFSLFFDQKLLSLFTINFARGDGTMFDSPVVITNNNSTWGTIRESVVNLGGLNDNGTVYGSGTLIKFVFSVGILGAGPIVLAAGTSHPAEGAGATDNDWTRLVHGRDSIDVSTSDGYFQNDPPKLGPAARFTYVPTKPLAGDTISFNATASFDPDNAASRITRYFWDFGNGASRDTASPILPYSFRPGAGLPIYGNFSVLLVIFDSDNNFTGMVTQLVGIGRPPLHDITISLGLDRSSVRPGDNITVTTIISDPGTYYETYNLSITYGPPTTPIKNYTNQTISPLYQQNSQTFANKLHTKGLSIGTYEVDAVVVAYFPGNGSIIFNTTAKKIFAIQPQQDSPLPYIIEGAVGVVAALIVIRFVLKRRRAPED